MAEFRGLCKNVALLDLLISFSAVQRKTKNSLLRAVRLKSNFFFQIISVGILLHVNNLKQQLEKKVK